MSITVEDMLSAYALAYDTWLDPESERENPTPEYARLIRQVVEHEYANLQAENARLRSELESIGTVAYLYGRGDLKAENDKLREQIELLITLLRNDCDIEASWDGLRKFWNIGLTESGCLMRDRACKAEAENAKLRDELDFCLKHVPNCDGCEAMLDCWECLRADSSQKERKRLDYENGQLRELVCIMHGELVSCEDNGYVCGGHKFDDRTRELGVEA